MFDFVHERKRLVQVVLALIVLPFALWGVDSYRHSGDVASLAKVNGEKITQQEFDNAMEQQRQRIREMAGSNFDAAMFDKPEIKHSVLEGLVTQRLLSGNARATGLVVSDEQMAQLIATVGVFQKDGKFDKQRYESALRAQGMTPAMFEQRVRQDLLTRQLTDAFTQNGFASQSAAENLIRLNEQQRVVSLAKLQLDPFMSQAKVDDASVKLYYDGNVQEFQIAERARVEYVNLSIDSLLSQVVATEQEVKAYYDEHAAEFGTLEQRQAAHILIMVSKQASDAERQAAKAKAEQVLQQVKQSPAKFAELAKQYSQDPGSAAGGGDLGMFGRGAMVRPFEESVFSLKVGQVSEIVQTDFGFHIIKLLGIKAAKAQALSEVRDLIVQRIKSQHASDKFAELAEKFSNTVYEQSDSLKPAAELVKAPVLTSVWLTKGQSAAAPWNEKMLQAIFSDDVLKNKRNTAAIEVATNSLLAARVAEYQPATVRSLAEVTPEIRKKLQRQQALQAAVKFGKELLDKLQRGEKTQVTWSSAQTIMRAKRAELRQELVQKIFQAEASKLPVFVGVEDAQQGFVIARIDEVKGAAVIEEAKRNGYLQQIRQITGEELLTAYLADSRKHAEISMKDFSIEDKK